MPETSTATRAFWSGTLSFGLVSIPVDLYAANRGRGFSLRMLGPDGQPLKRQYVCAREGKPLDRDELVRGFEVDEGEFVTVTKEELEALEPDKTRDIDLNRFVPRASISPAYFERSYYLVPSGNSTKAYRLLAATMEKTGQAGVATFVMRSKAYVIAIFAEGGVLAAETLRFADELRSADDVGLAPPKKLDTKLVAHMKKIIENGKLDAFDPDALEGFHDTQAEHLRALAEKKLKEGQDVSRAEGGEDAAAADAEGDDPEDVLSEGEGKVIDLMQVLRRRLGQDAAPADRSGHGGGKAAKPSDAGKGRAAASRSHGGAARKAKSPAAHKATKAPSKAAKRAKAAKPAKASTHASGRTRKKQSR